MTAVQWLEKHINDSYYEEFIEKAKEMEKNEKLKNQLFFGKVSDILGWEKTLELLIESQNDLKL